jgi:hypothetical protein
LRFTFLWFEQNRWEDKDYSLKYKPLRRDMRPLFADGRGEHVATEQARAGESQKALRSPPWWGNRSAAETAFALKVNPSPVSARNNYEHSNDKERNGEKGRYRASALFLSYHRVFPKVEDCQQPIQCLDHFKLQDRAIRSFPCEANANGRPETEWKPLLANRLTIRK